MPKRDRKRHRRNRGDEQRGGRQLRDGFHNAGHRRGRGSHHGDVGEHRGPTLAELRPGHVAVVARICGGEDVRRRAIELGIVPGARVETIVGQGNGARVVKVGESRLVVSIDVAHHVRVSNGKK